MAASCISLPGEQPTLALGGFNALDERAQALTRGFSLVHAPSDLAPSLARHVERRARALGRRVICVDGLAFSEPWRELAHRLGVVGDEPLGVAARILKQLRDEVLLVCAPSSTRWGAAVADALAFRVTEHPTDAWIVELTRDRRAPQIEPLIVSQPVDLADIERFWHALFSDERRAGRPRLERLEQLERSWWDARAAAPVETTLSADARRALATLALVGKSLDRERQGTLGIEPVRHELLGSGLVSTDAAGRLWLHAAVTAVASKAQTREVATELSLGDDAWDGMRAAELWLSVDDGARAVAAAERALAHADAHAREDLWHRLERALRGVEADVASLLRLSAFALEVGDTEPALSLARLAAVQAADAFDPLLALGKATAARGDLSTAEELLERAISCAADASSRRTAAVELAEVLCMRGVSERARTLAEEAVTAPDAPTRLSARSVIGKLLLAAGDWDAADRSFAEDAHFAAATGEVEAELRAELNRATALVGAGRRTEARALLEAIMGRAERVESARAQAFAASNLAVLASRRHDYARALALREQALVAFRRIGNRKWLARSMIYLADLRLDLGFVSEAEQALAFARQVLGQTVPPTQAAWLSLVASRVHLERGHVGRAAEEIDAALGSARQSTDGTMLADCHAFAARVALADDDPGRAAAETTRAREVHGGAHKGAEVALLEALVARAEGRSFEDEARRALSLARASRDRARMAEAHVLLHDALTSAGEEAQAGEELESARKIHRAISASLPPELRARYDERAGRSCGRDAAPVTQPSDAVESCVRRAAARQSGTPRSSTPRNGMVGSHPAMLRMFDVLEKIAAADATVLVSGESGTGKELVADALHRQSGRHHGPLVKVNCAALVETLLLSELFGHEKGAFTGATSQRRGCFEHADGGTIFLDEIGDISPATQAALLRVLQDRTFHRVGGTEPVRVDVRVICATHRDVEAMVAAGTFREDLYYRLSGVVLAVPPLRDRLADLPLLASEILLRMARENDAALKRLEPDALALLAGHHWPGNVRELENVLRAAALFTDGDAIGADDLSRHAASLRDATPAPEATAVGGASESGDAPEDAVYAAVRGGTGLRELQRRLEQECIVRALRETDGHVTRAAALLGMKRPRLSQLIKQHNLRTAGGDP